MQVVGAEGQERHGSHEGLVSWDQILPGCIRYLLESLMHLLLGVPALPSIWTLVKVSIVSDSQVL